VVRSCAFFLGLPTLESPLIVDPDINLTELIEQFGSEDKCHAFLEELRWPDGVKCPRCGSDKISRIKARRQFDCDACRYQFSVRVGTLFHDSKLPLWKWFLAVYMMGESNKGISANQLKRMLGVSYKTAWYLCHRIRAAMKDEGAPLLSGIVEVDETFIGGKRRYPIPGKPGIGPDFKSRKTMVIGAVQRGGRIRLQAGGNRDKATLQGFVRANVDDKTEAIYTDEFYAYGDLTDANTKHRRVSHKEDEWVNGEIHTNTVESAWSLFDRAVIGAYHKLSVKHLPAYLDEFAFRFNNRENAFLFRDTLLRLVEADALPYRELVESH
jgi:transposase-like protein